MLRVSVMSGDNRNARLCELLYADGVHAKLFSGEDLRGAAAWGEVIILPVTGMSPELFHGFLDEGQTMITGKDFLDREEFTVLNAVATTEGALEIAMSAMPVTLHRSRGLVIGYGRIGKLLCKHLAAFGAEVSAAARRESDFAWMAAHGYKAINSLHLEGELGDFDVIFNTVPAMMLPYVRLLELKKGCLVIDLASAPGGVDFSAAERLDVDCRWALGLPGKLSPESAAIYMRDTVYHILRERGVAL